MEKRLTQQNDENKWKKYTRTYWYQLIARSRFLKYLLNRIFNIFFFANRNRLYLVIVIWGLQWYTQCDKVAFKFNSALKRLYIIVPTINAYTREIISLIIGIAHNSTDMHTRFLFSNCLSTLYFIIWFHDLLYSNAQ